MIARDTTAYVAEVLRRVARSRGPIERRQALSELGELGHHRVITEPAIRAAVDAITDSTYRDAAAALLLDDEQGYLTGRRHQAARVVGVTLDTFRRHYEPRVLDEVAYQLVSDLDSKLASGRAVAGAGDRNDVGERTTAPEPLDTAAILGKSLEGVDNAVVLVRTLFLVKMAGKLVGRTLTPEELEALGRVRDRVMTDPAAALAFLTEPDGQGDRDPA